MKIFGLENIPFSDISICWEEYVMMTTLVSSLSAGMDPRQMTQPMQLKAHEKTAAEELKAEEQQQTETISTPNVNVVKSLADIRMMQIHQAADAGILRPMWLEMMDMDPDMPRMSDIINRPRVNKNDNAERAADEAERVDNYERSAEEAERAGKPERAADGAEHTGKPERAAEGSERAAKSERATDGAERSVKSERAADGAKQAVASSK